MVDPVAASGFGEGQLRLDLLLVSSQRRLVLGQAGHLGSCSGASAVNPGRSH